MRYTNQLYFLNKNDTLYVKLLTIFVCMRLAVSLLSIGSILRLSFVYPSFILCIKTLQNYNKK